MSPIHESCLLYLLVRRIEAHHHGFMSRLVNRYFEHDPFWAVPAIKVFVYIVNFLITRISGVTLRSGAWGGLKGAVGGGK